MADNFNLKPYFNSDYYIHLYKSHIGNLIDSNGYSSSQINNYINSKQKMIEEASIFQYKSAFKKTLDYSIGNGALLNLALADDNFFEALNTELRTNAQQEILNRGNEISSLYNSGNDLSKACSNLQAHDLNAFNNFFVYLEQMISLCSAPEAQKELKALLTIKSINGAKFYSDSMASGLQNVIAGLQRDAMSAKIKNLNATADELKEIAHKLSLMENGFRTGVNASGNIITSKSAYAKHITNTVLVPYFGEIFQSLKNSTGALTLANEKRKMTGMSGVENEITNALGQILDYGQAALFGMNISSDRASDSKIRQGKMDWQNKVGIHVSASINGGSNPEGVLHATIGGSVKTYLNNDLLIKQNDNGDWVRSLSTNSIFSSGSMGSAFEAIISTFNSTASRYLMMNIFATNGTGEWSKPYQNLLKSLLKRHITRLFATRNSSQEFNNLFYANGAVVTTWDLLQGALNSSQAYGNNSIFKLLPSGSVENKKIKIDKQFNLQSAMFERNRRVNQSIRGISLKAEVHLDKLINTLGI